MLNFMNFWSNMVDKINSATAVLVIFGGIASIVAILLLSILKIKEKNQILAIIIPVFASCFLMVPVISSFNNLASLKVKGAIVDETKVEIQAQRAEAERLKAENKVKMLEKEKLENQITIGRQSIEIQALTDSKKLLENAQISMQSFQKILQVALLETHLKQTLVRKEQITPTTEGWGLKADRYYDEVLVVIAHDIIAKFGVDLNEVKLRKVDDFTVIVSGIKSKFIGTSKNIADTPVHEIRRIDYKNNAINNVIVQQDRPNLQKAEQYAKEYERDFQLKLSEGLELGFMDDAVVQLAQNFITVMLAPLYKNIKFDNNDRPGALPLMAYLQKELEENNKRTIELLDINENLLLVNKQLEQEAAGLDKAINNGE